MRFQCLYGWGRVIDDELDKLRKKVENATNTKAEKKEFLKKIRTMQSHFEKSYGIPLILNKYIKVKNGKYLVFCKNKKHLDAMRDVVIGWFKTTGIKDVHSYTVYSDYPDKEKDYKEFQEDKSDSAKILFSINMLNEGLHIDDISGLLMLRTTQSNLIYLQQLGRLLKSDNMDKYLLVFDFVNNFSSVNDGIGLLKEIKDAIAREKEGDPNFDDSDFLDIDTFFVMEQVREIQELFQEIEGQLLCDWDLYIKALKQFKQRVGDCDVPQKHVEIVNGVNVKLGQWCSRTRKAKSGNGHYLLTKEKESQLNEIDFIWDIPKYRFEKNVADCINFYKANGRLPYDCSENKEERKLRNSINDYKKCMSSYPQWRQDLLKKIPSLFDNKSSFDRFYDMALMYKQRYGHVDIKCPDIIDGYNIGNIYYNLIKDYKNKKLSIEQVEKLKCIGIDITKGKLEKQFDEKMQLAEQALSEGVVISKKNQIYHGVNLYNWYHNHKNVFSKEELQTMQKIINSKKRAVNIIDLENNQVSVFISIDEAGRALYSEFHVTDNEKKGKAIIINRLTGNTKKPIYKGLRFEYADKVKTIK